MGAAGIAGAQYPPTAVKNVKVFPAASRVSGGEILYVMGPPASLDVARLNPATGDTALATTIYC